MRRAIKFKARNTTDNQSVIGALLIGKRLLREGKATNGYEALDIGVPMSAPKDEVVTWWAARSALVRAAGGEFDHLDVQELVALFDVAGHNVAKLETANREARK